MIQTSINYNTNNDDVNSRYRIIDIKSILVKISYMLRLVLGSHHLSTDNGRLCITGNALPGSLRQFRYSGL
jgi:hypothetical protein